MNNRELLELAALAYGIEHLIGYGIDSYAPYWLNDPKQPEPRYWNPLDDDGDALRLTVKLKIDTKHYANYVVCWYEDYFGTGKIFYGNDEYTATRYAIVRAAAEIGKSMKVH